MMDLCLEDDVLAMAPIPSIALGDLIRLVSEYLQTDPHYGLNREMRRESGIVEVLDVGRSGWAYVRRPPIHEITSIQHRSSPNVPWIAATDVECYTDTQTSRVLGHAQGRVRPVAWSLPVGRQTVEITYEGGLATETQDLDLQLRRGAAVAVIAVHRRTITLAVGTDDRSVEATGETISLGRGWIPKEAEHLIRPYRRLGVM
jgi:hypothetical protein